MRRFPQFVREPVVLLSITLATLSILLSIHADVFEQYPRPLTAALWEPWSCLFSSSPDPINLSSLLNTESGAQALAASNNNPLYIFVLDVSKTMLMQNISGGEWEQYVNNVKSIRGDQLPLPSCFPSKAPSILTTFDIARGELCRYVDSVPDGSHVSIWKFGDTPTMIVPENVDNNRYIEFKKTDKGGHTKVEPLSKISTLTAIDNRTDFERLFVVLSEKYHDLINSGTEVHFIIISDFIHDIGGDQYKKERFSDDGASPDGYLWKSRYRISALRIADQLQELSKTSNTTFHLAKISAASRTVYSILPLFNDTMGVFSYRDTQLLSKLAGREFDFLRSYYNTDTAIKFFYTLGDSQTQPTKIMVDDNKYENTMIRVALASEIQTLETVPLKIKIGFKASGGNPEGIIRLNSGGITGKLERAQDTVSLEALSVLQLKEATSYRLLISLDDRNGTNTNASRSKTFSVPIKFYRQLDSISGISILLSELLVLLFGVWSLLRFIRSKRQPPDVLKERLALPE